ncbi:Dolichyl-phosphate beta-D-mannosyltransferase [Paenibacillus nuruki]|uniref:Dolichyl-phosphate beta-D-mannosyltransferase n=1 Tax=Paenibacillus nuruki TaxID=1886670 RepID=A0A1E3L9H5_9BACL|nr:glycosyltransferase family 2 protein [Paenibacillus nuruki]ODP30439.1 Dolichyl-phosphate beta-D-mannosyltransferase [Paenibacillus nuruki]
MRYSIVVPVYNEEAVVLECYRRLTEVMQQTHESYELIFVNDGSRDQTASIVNQLCASDASVKWIDFSRNFGHQIAITAGMDHAQGEAIVVIDADLQDPPELILQMIEKWKEGFDVVYATRAERKGETGFKKWSASMFYRTLNKLSDIDIPLDTGDFRLIDRKVCEAMKTMKENNRFVRGLVSWVGFRQTSISYVREERFAGETKYPLKKMIRFASDALVAFSLKPLKLASILGSVVSLFSFFYLIFVLAQKLLHFSTTPGWASIVATILFLNGIILVILGLIGEYIGRIYDEVKQRPLYLIQQTRNFAQEQPLSAHESLPEKRRFVSEQRHAGF